MSPTSPDVRRQLVLGAADLIGRRGLRGATVRDLAWHSGTPEGSTYHYFPGGKQELAAAAVRLIGEQVAQQVGTGCEDGGPLHGLQVLIDAFRQLMVSTDCQGGCPVLAVAVEGSEGYAVAPALVAAAEVYDQWTDILAASLARHGVDEPDAKRIGALVVATLEGAVALCRANGRIEPLNEIAKPLESLVESLVDADRDTSSPTATPKPSLAKANGHMPAGS